MLLENILTIQFWESKGLGYEFLRHVERTKILVHLIAIDDASATVDDYYQSYLKINQELKEYGYGLEHKKQIVVMNKIDLPYVSALYEKVKDCFKNHNISILPLSAATGDGLSDLEKEMVRALKAFTLDEKESKVEEDNEFHTFTLEELKPKNKVAKKIIRR